MITQSAPSDSFSPATLSRPRDSRRGHVVGMKASSYSDYFGYDICLNQSEYALPIPLSDAYVYVVFSINGRTFSHDLTKHIRYVHYLRNSLGVNNRVQLSKL